jgi:hypothetical protein
MAIIIGSSSSGVLGTVTVAEIKSAVQAEGYDTDTSAQQTVMLRMILRRMYGLRRWRFLLQETDAFSATIANTGQVDISSLGRGLQIESVRIWQGTDYRDLDPWDRNTMERNRHIDRDAGVPTKWARYGNSVVVWPIPDGTYTLRIVWQGLTTLPSADGDTVLWPETHLDVLVYAMILKLARRQHDWTGLDRARADFTEALNEMFRDEQVDQNQAAEHIKKWVGWSYLEA